MNNQKKILISADGPEKTKVSIPVRLQGGSPWFGYIWIDDVCYTIIKKQRSYKVVKTTMGSKL